MEIGLSHQLDQIVIPQVDLILAYYLDYYSPRHPKADRKVQINETVMQSLGQIILLCVKNEEHFFYKLQNERTVAD